MSHSTGSVRNATNIACWPTVRIHLLRREPPLESIRPAAAAAFWRHILARATGQFR